MRPFFACLIGAVSVPFVLMGPVLAQSNPATPKPSPTVQKTGPVNLKSADAVKTSPQPWVVNCAAATGKAALNCSMTQTVFARANGLRLIAISISKIAGSDHPRLQLSLPHGVALQSGTEIWVDKGARKNVPIRNADANGSYAIVDIDADLLESLRKGASLNTAFNALDGQRIVLQVSLNGFTAAFSKL